MCMLSTAMLDRDSKGELWNMWGVFGVPRQSCEPGRFGWAFLLLG